jgi:hypothetical protein
MTTIPIEAQVSTDQLLHAAQQLPPREFSAFVKQLLEFQPRESRPSQVTSTPLQDETIAGLAAQVQATGQRILGLSAGAITVSDDFDAPLGDDFWLGKE